jgi:hypothetical protein
MIIIKIFGAILVAIGLLLTTNILSYKIDKGIGWALASLGMFLFFAYGMICGNMIFASLSLLFAIVNAYFSVNYFKKDKE